jgi:hypothetical protein
LANSDSKRDFFVSRNKADADWAVWIAWVLEEAGYTTVLQDWDFRPGEIFILKMDEVAQQAERTIAVLSEDYLKAEYSQMEWEAAVREKRLLPVRVRECELRGLLGGIIHIDLLGLDESAAGKRLLNGVKKSLRDKPDERPRFPGESEEPGETGGKEPAGLAPLRSVAEQPYFPGPPTRPYRHLWVAVVTLLVAVGYFAWSWGEPDCGDIQRVACLKLDLVGKPSQTLCFEDGRGDITKNDISNLRNLTGQGILPSAAQVNDCPCEWRGGTDKSAIESFNGSNCLFSLPLPDGVGLILLNLNVKNQTKVFTIYVHGGRGS